MSVQPEILVSVCCITYDHEAFIAQALEGFLMQRTTFSFEVIVHDDASTDATASIIRSYQERFPDKIKPIFQTVNQYSIAPGRMTTIVHKAARGRYIALCEGDDYWTDPLKLQKQVDFLEANPDYSVTYHDARVEDAEGRLLLASKIPAGKARDYNEQELLMNETFILTLTIVYRNDPLVALDNAHETEMILNGDNFLTSRLGLTGKGKYMADIGPAVYREHGGGIWSSQNEEVRKLTQVSSWMWMGAYYNRIGRPDLARRFFDRVSKRVKPMSEWYQLRHRRSYQLFARIMGWFKIDLPR
jgi:glycosyltransferase involved in cell wall biosynthesis